MAMCADTGVGLVPYSRKAKAAWPAPGASSPSGPRRPCGPGLRLADGRAGRDAVQKLAEARGVTMAQIALAWVLRHPAVSAPIVGATKPHHLPEAVAALEVMLTGDEAAALEQPYINQGPSWF